MRGKYWSQTEAKRQDKPTISTEFDGCSRKQCPDRIPSVRISRRPVLNLTSVLVMAMSGRTPNVRTSRRPVLDLTSVLVMAMSGRTPNVRTCKHQNKRTSRANLDEFCIERKDRVKLSELDEMAMAHKTEPNARTSRRPVVYNNIVAIFTEISAICILNRTTTACSQSKRKFQVSACPDTWFRGLRYIILHQWPLVAYYASQTGSSSVFVTAIFRVSHMEASSDPPSTGFGPQLCPCARSPTGTQGGGFGFVKTSITAVVDAVSGVSSPPQIYRLL